MKSWKWVAGFVGAAFLLLAIRVLVAGRASDTELIQSSLEDSLTAGREGRPGGVLEYLSESLTFNESEVGSRRQIARFVRESRPRVKITNKKPVVSPDGETATILTDVNIDVDYLGMKMNRDISNVAISFRKEPDTQFLIFPSCRWRIIGVKAPEVNASDFMAPQ